MKIKLARDIITEKGKVLKGVVLEVDRDNAQALIAQGWAVEYKDPPAPKVKPAEDKGD